MREKTHELINLLRAKDPLIYVETSEEDDFVLELCDAISQMTSDSKVKYKIPPQIYTFSRASGMFKVNLADPLTYNPDLQVEDITSTKDALSFVRKLQWNIGAPKDPLQDILNAQTPNQQNNTQKDVSGPAIFIFKDLHMYFSDKDIVRFLRDCKEKYITENYCPIIVTAPVVDIPPELEKIFTYWQLPLITKMEIYENINRYIADYPEDTKNEIVTACCGLTTREIFRALMHSMAKNSDRKVLPSDIYEEKIQLVKKSGCIDYVAPKYTIDDLGGCDNFKVWIKKVKESVSPEAKAFGIPSPKGAMLVGVPGTSKSASAEILASYLKIPLLNLQMSKIMGSFVGQSERAISNALRIAKSIAPCVLLIDECEKVLGGFQSSNNSDAGTLSRVMASILNFLQEDTDIIVMMTSNDVSQLPPELTRSGRIDTQWIFDLPNKFEREEIIKIYLKKNNLEVTNNIVKHIVDETENFTGAEIKSAVKDMLINSYYRQKNTNGLTEFSRSLSISDIDSAVNNTVTIWKSSREKIEAFREYSKDRYLNASKSVDELKSSGKSSIFISKPSLRPSPLKAHNVFTLQ